MPGYTGAWTACSCQLLATGKQRKLCSASRINVLECAARGMLQDKPSRRRHTICAVAAPHTELDHPHRSNDTATTSMLDGSSADSPSHSGHGAMLEGDQRQVAVFKAHKLDRHPVTDLDRPLAEYMRLPASQYSVLDAQKVERLDEDTFRCHVGGLSFLGFTVKPVLTVSVIVKERGPIVKLLNTQLEGSKAVVAANDQFDATMTNIVTWEADAEAGGSQKLLCSDTSIQVCIQIPRWARFMPNASIQRAGSSLMQQVLNSAVPKFLKQLQKDYELWASGDESRKPVGNGKL